MDFQTVINILTHCQIPNPVKEAEALFKEVLNIPKTTLHSKPTNLTDEQTHTLKQAIARRLAGEPLQYITGRVDFMGLELEVGQGVLIPRPETELLAEIVLKVSFTALKNNPKPYVLDLCTGSGCLAIYFALQLPHATVIASDISLDALKFAHKNLTRYNCGNVSLLASDLFDGIKETTKFNLIVCNPPYVKSSEIKQLQSEVSKYEPHISLDGGEDGMDFYRKILCKAKEYLHTDSLIAFEIGHNQGEMLSCIAKANGFGLVQIYKDYSACDRVALISK